MIYPPLFALFSQLAALPLASTPVPVEVHVVRAGWTAAASPEEVAAALALRLPSVRVLVVDEPAAADASAACTVVLDAANGGAPRLTVACPAAAPVLEPLPDAPAVELARRAAVDAAILVAALTAPRGEPSPTPGPTAAPQHTPDRPPGVETVTPAPPEAETPVRAALRLAAGLAVAPDVPDTNYAITVDARVFLEGRAHLTAGATLAGPFMRTFGAETDSSADRSLWAGAGYRVPFGRFSVDTSLALAYTIPLLDAGGEADADLREEDRSSRFGLRGGVALAWSIHPALAIVVELAAHVSFVERSILAGDREALGLGTLVASSTAGLELRL